jgi:quercetin dioxygenase-like cupin family protein
MQIMIAKLTIKLTLTVAVLSLSAHTFALEPNAAVKVTPLLKTSTSWDGQPIVYPKGKAEITAMRVEIAPGAETGWHKHKVPSFAVMLEGSLEVSLKDGRVKRLEAGDVLTEVVNTLHTGRNVGNTPVRLVVFYAGIEGKAHSAK